MEIGVGAQGEKQVILRISGQPIPLMDDILLIRPKFAFTVLTLSFLVLSSGVRQQAKSLFQMTVLHALEGS